MRQQLCSRHILCAVLLFFGIVSCPAEETRTLAELCTDFGVSEETNTMLHATERDAKGYHGRMFSMFRGNSQQTQAIDKLWQALAETKFVEIRTREPATPTVLIVLNTGMSSKMLPRVGIWVDPDGFLHFLTDREKRPREFMVFSGREVVAWTAENMKTYGQVR